MTFVPPPIAENRTPDKKPSQLLLFVLASALGFIGVTMVLIAALNPSPPHDGPVGTITELAGAHTTRRHHTTYHYVVEFMLDGTPNTFEYSSKSALDVGAQIPLVINSERGTARQATTSTSSSAMIVGFLFVGTAVAFLAYGAHQNGSFHPGWPDWLGRASIWVEPLGMSAFLLLVGIIFGSFFLSIQLKYLTLGPTENAEIISADLMGVENVILTVEMASGEQRSVTVHYRDYLLDKGQVAVFSETDPLQARSGMDSLGPRERLASLLVGLGLGTAILAWWSRSLHEHQTTPSRSHTADPV